MRVPDSSMNSSMMDGPEEKDESSKDYSPEELDEAMKTLEQADKIRSDKGMMAALGPHLQKKVKTIKSMAGLRSAAKSKILESQGVKDE